MAELDARGLDNMIVLGIESSCDETSISILKDGIPLCNLISTQYFHSKYGGIIPELASRSHLQKISYLLGDALAESKINLSDINLIAVTNAPGLAGSLLVGTNFAKGLALKQNIPIIPINHIEAHIYSPLIENKGLNEIEFPFLSLVVSGGHTALFKINSFTDYQLIGSTVDDAAGEAFDKIGKMLGLNYPAGPEIDKLSKSGNPKAFDFPKSMLHSGDYNFSFSGLKTSVRYFLEKNFKSGIPAELLNDFAASVQSAIVDVLIQKSINCAKEHKINEIYISGGVSANSYLRSQFESNPKKIKSFFPSIKISMDNAEMIAYLAFQRTKNLTKNELIQNYSNFDFVVNSKAIRK